MEQEELHEVSFSPNIIGVINSRKMRWAGHVADMGEKKNTYRNLNEASFSFLSFL